MADSIINIQSLSEKKNFANAKGLNPTKEGLSNQKVLDLTEEILLNEEDSPQDPDDPLHLKFLAFITVLLAGLFACIDGLYLSMSALRLGCSIDTESFNTVSGDNTKFDKLTNNWGNHKAILIGFLLLIPTTILLAVLGDKKLDINKKTQTLWFYLRSAFSSLKNTRTAAVSTAFIAQAFAHSTHFYAWANPIGLGLGLLVFLPNILWLQRERRIREELIETNKTTEQNLNKATNLDELGNRPVVAKHSRLKQGALYASVFADGLSDGIYIYASLFLVLGLSTMVFPPALLIAATITMAVITIVSIASKINAERKQSAALELSAMNVDIAYLRKKQELSPEGLNDVEKSELASLEAKQEKLNETVNSDNKSALFLAGRQTIMGLKNMAAAAAILLLIPGVNVIVGLPIFITIKILGAAYALYLCIPEIKKYMESRKNKNADPENQEADVPVPAKAPELQIQDDVKAKKSLSSSISSFFYSNPKENDQPEKPKTESFSQRIENHLSFFASSVSTSVVSRLLPSTIFAP